MFNVKMRFVLFQLKQTKIYHFKITIRKLIYDKRYRKQKGQSRMDIGNIGYTSHRSLTTNKQKTHPQHKKLR